MNRCEVKHHGGQAGVYDNKLGRFLCMCPGRMGGIDANLIADTMNKTLAQPPPEAKGTIGYIVNEEMNGGPSVLLEHDNDLWKNVPAGSVLLNDTREVAVFPTRKAARLAIKRKMAWWHAQGRHMNWPDDAYAIRRLCDTAPDGQRKG